MRYDLSAHDLGSGAPLWSRSQDNGTETGGSHGEQDLHPVVADGVVYAEPRALELRTGEPIAGWRWPWSRRRGCGTLSASARSLYFRDAHPTGLDLSTHEVRKVTSCSRPGCWINIIPAGGLLLIPEASSGCTCDFPVQTSMAFAPEGEPSGPAGPAGPSASAAPGNP